MKKDRFISLEETNHDNPYDDPELLAFEDKFGYLMSYKFPFNERDIRSVSNYRASMKRNVCGNCTRCAIRIHRGTIYNRYTNCEGCRIKALKSGMTRSIKISKLLAE